MKSIFSMKNQFPDPFISKKMDLSDIGADLSYTDSILSDIKADLSYTDSILSDIKADLSYTDSILSDIKADLSYTDAVLSVYRTVYLLNHPKKGVQLNVHLFFLFHIPS
jgi:hypothetical protein